MDPIVSGGLTDRVDWTKKPSIPNPHCPRQKWNIFKETRKS